MPDQTATLTKYISLDPGGTTGWAEFNAAGDIVEFGDLKGKAELIELLRTRQPTTVICEDFTLMPWKAKDLAFNNLDTVRVIGWIESYCYYNNVELVMQLPNIKPIAYMWAGINKPKNHKHTHQTDAYVHGVYFLQKSGIRKPQQGKANG